jgi:hypothetical protein
MVAGKDEVPPADYWPFYCSSNPTSYYFRVVDIEIAAVNHLRKASRAGRVEK